MKIILQISFLLVLSGCKLNESDSQSGGPLSGGPDIITDHEIVVFSEGKHVLPGRDTIDEWWLDVKNCLASNAVPPLVISDEIEPPVVVITTDVIYGTTELAIPETNTIYIEGDKALTPLRWKHGAIHLILHQSGVSYDDNSAHFGAYDENGYSEDATDPNAELWKCER